MVVLRVRAFFHNTFQIYQVSLLQLLSNYVCGITVIFGTCTERWKPLLFNIFASKNSFSYKNIFENAVDCQN